MWGLSDGIASSTIAIDRQKVVVILILTAIVVIDGVLVGAAREGDRAAIHVVSSSSSHCISLRLNTKRYPIDGELFQLCYY
jgi:hypothetical protein